VPYPCPGNCDRSFSMSQTDDQQFMGKTYFGSIYIQPYFFKVSGLHFRPAASNGLVPISDVDVRVCQKAAKALNQADQLPFTRDFSRNSAQAYQTALMYADYQPDEVLNARFSFYRIQLSNAHVPSMIEIVVRHYILMFLVNTISGVHMFCRSTFLIIVVCFWITYEYGINPTTLRPFMVDT